MAQRNDAISNEFRLDAIHLPTTDNTPTNVSPFLIDKYFKLTFAQKEALLDKLGTTANVNAVAGANASDADADADAAETNLFLKLLFLQQTPLLNGPQFTQPRDGERLAKLTQALTTDVDVERALRNTTEDKSTFLNLRDVSIIMLSLGSALVVGYVAASIATATAAAAAAATATTTTTRTTKKKI